MHTKRRIPGKDRKKSELSQNNNSANVSRSFRRLRRRRREIDLAEQVELHLTPVVVPSGCRVVRVADVSAELHRSEVGLSRLPVEVVGRRAIRPHPEGGTLGAGQSQPDAPLGAERLHQRVDELAGAQVHRGQTGAPVQRGAHVVRHVPRDLLRRDQVARVAQALPAGRTRGRRRRQLRDVLLHLPLRLLSDEGSETVGAGTKDAVQPLAVGGVVVPAGDRGDVAGQEGGREQQRRPHGAAREVQRGGRLIRSGLGLRGSV